MRIDPRLSAAETKTYQILAPVSTHFKPARCADVDCPRHQLGWLTVVDEGTDLGQRQAHYIRTGAGRGFTERREGALTVFEFPAGQECFTQHRVRVERPEIFVVRDGDWRGNPRGTRPRRHANANDWVDDFQNHQSALADRLAKG